MTAGNNALLTLQFATKAENKLRDIADTTDDLIVEAFALWVDVDDPNIALQRRIG